MGITPEQTQDTTANGDEQGNAQAGNSECVDNAKLAARRFLASVGEVQTGLLIDIETLNTTIAVKDHCINTSTTQFASIVVGRKRRSLKSVKIIRHPPKVNVAQMNTWLLVIYDAP